MNNEIIKLGLPRGKWQESIKQSIPVATKVECSYPDDNSVFFQVFKDAELVVKFALSFMYGCKGILISHSMFVEPAFRGQGIAKALQPIKCMIARDLQVSMLLATVNENNTSEKAIIKNWKLIEAFKNLRSGDCVELFSTKIKTKKPKKIVVKKPKKVRIEEVLDTEHTCPYCGASSKNTDKAIECSNPKCWEEVIKKLVEFKEKDVGMSSSNPYEFRCPHCNRFADVSSGSGYCSAGCGQFPHNCIPERWYKFGERWWDTGAGCYRLQTRTIKFIKHEQDQYGNDEDDEFDWNNIIREQLGDAI